MVVAWRLWHNNCGGTVVVVVVVVRWSWRGGVAWRLWWRCYCSKIQNLFDFLFKIKRFSIFEKDFEKTIDFRIYQLYSD
jgi:hypothetical protein